MPFTTVFSTENIKNKIAKPTQPSINNIASVLIPIIKDHNDELHLLFQVRAAHLAWQPGDICFPGGRMETVDHHSPIATAIRETEEELGISRDSIEVYGALPALSSAIGLTIHPVVGQLHHTQYNLNKDEVASIFTVPLTWFHQNKPLKSTILVAHKPANDFPFKLLPNRSKDWLKRSEHPVYFYHYQHYVIWGVTAQIIQLFLDKIVEH